MAFSCTKCQKCYTSSQILRRHVCKPSHCNVCGKMYKKRAFLKRHKCRGSTICPFCGKQLGRRFNLQRHLKSKVCQKKKKKDAKHVSEEHTEEEDVIKTEYSMPLANEECVSNEFPTRNMSIETSESLSECNKDMEYVLPDVNLTTYENPNAAAEHKYNSMEMQSQEDFAEFLKDMIQKQIEQYTIIINQQLEKWELINIVENKCMLVQKLQTLPSRKSHEHCLCNEPVTENMLKCSANNCKIRLFHQKCLQIKEQPTGDWFCPMCYKPQRESRQFVCA